MNQFPVHYFIPGMELLSTWTGAFSPEECDKIVGMCELMAHQRGGLHQGVVGGKPNPDGTRGELNPEVRRVGVLPLEPDRESDWIHHRISHLTGRRNNDMYQLDLQTFDGFQFSSYDAKQLGHYDWHFDMQKEPPNPALHRKLSVVVGLTDPDDYEGGDLVFLLGGSPDKQTRVRVKKGDILFFYSFVPHKVEPVTKGVRNTLVTWALGEKFR